MTISTPHPESTIPTPTISPPWAPTGSRAATARMRTSPTGTSSSRSKGSGARGQGPGRQGSGARGQGPVPAGAPAAFLTPHPSPLTPGAERLTPDPWPLIPGRGFTLIELLVVLVALVIVASAVVPALRNAGHQQDLAEVADRVAASARFARDEAVARQAAIGLTVALAPAAVQLAVDASGAAVVSGSMAMGASRGIRSSSPLLPLPSAFALVRLPPRFQARLEALPETFNGSATTTPTSGGTLETLRFPP